MAVKPITVSQLNDYLARIVDMDPLLSNVRVTGEASGVHYHSSGHLYFSLVDEQSKLNCFLSRDLVKSLDYRLEDGMSLILTGGVSVYRAGGSYSLYVRSIETTGEGSLAIAFERMKKQLAAEGLFDSSHKKKLPSFPRWIGVVTSESGAAVRDILKIIRGRNHTVDVTIFPAPVQGDGAGDRIAAIIDAVNERFPEIELLIVGRGGGSAEDLKAFNEEGLARSIYRSDIPVISAVGHEIDFTIADLVADVRAETPTAAAQIAVPDTDELAAELDSLLSNLYRQLNNNVMYYSMMTENTARSMMESMRARVQDSQNEIEGLKLILSENDPGKVLAKGYSIAEDREGRPITDAAVLSPGDPVHLVFRMGSADLTTVEVREERNE